MGGDRFAPFGYIKVGAIEQTTSDRHLSLD